MTSSKEWRRQQVEDIRAAKQAKIDLLAQWQREGRLALPREMLDALSPEMVETRVKFAYQDGTPYVDIATDQTHYIGKSYFDSADQTSKDFLRQSSVRILCRGFAEDGRVFDQLVVYFVPYAVERSSILNGVPFGDLANIEPTETLLPPAIRKAMRQLATPDRGPGDTLWALGGKTPFLLQNQNHSCSFIFFKYGPVCGKDLTMTIPAPSAFHEVLENQIKETAETFCLAQLVG